MMDKILLMVVFIACTFGVYAQDKIDYAEVSLETEADYAKAKPYVLDAADYILSSPINNADLRRVDALQLILTWMEGSSEVFEFDKYDKIGDDINVKAAYIASSVKNNLKQESETDFWNTFLTYCSHQSAYLMVNADLRKMIDSHKNMN